MISTLAIVGQTASGKSALALQVALKLRGEIIAADSKTVYKYLDIGTAKPTLSDRAQVPHHLLDVVEPGQSLNVADFQKLANQVIDDILARGCLPIVVGGSGLYVDSLLRSYNFTDNLPAIKKLRQKLQKLTTDELQALIMKKGLVLPENAKNKRYLIRTLERGRLPQGRKLIWHPNILAVGLNPGQSVLRERIERRLSEMLQAGLLEEVQQAWQIYPEESEALKGNVYQAFRPYLRGLITLEEASADFIRRDLALSKKQMTWFKRHHQIHWFTDSQSALTFICDQFGKITE